MYTSKKISKHSILSIKDDKDSFQNPKEIFFHKSGKKNLSYVLIQT